MIRRKRFWLGLVVSLVFVAIFVARTDFGEIRDAFSDADLLLAVAAVPLYFVGFWLRTMRWHLLLRPLGEVPVLRLYPIVLIGLMANNVAPARVGEVVRSFLVGERASVSKSAAFGTVAIDRVFDGLTLVAILGVVTALAGADAAVAGIGVGTALVFAAAAASLFLLAFSPTQARGWLMRLIGLLPAGLAASLSELLDSFLTGLGSLRSPWVLAQAALLSLLSWLVEATMYFVVGEAFSLGVGFHVYLLVTAAANLALSVFASPGGIGPFEVATREILVFFEVGSASASAYAIALHVLLLAPVIAVGFGLLWAAQLSLRDLMGIPADPVPAQPALE